ncbi:MAG: hypothetical protein CO090_04735, partial [Acidobacteria bacterium CG_4_9_14_3_um_filter_49_7]
MPNGDLLDGWKSISTFIGKSVKTIQRWEQESDFPVHRVPGRRSVFAMKSEVNAWLKRQPEPEKYTEDERPAKTGSFDQLFRPRQVSPLVLVLITIAIGVMAFQDLKDIKNTQPVLGPLTVRLVPYS